jgi:hypothetical protein
MRFKIGQILIVDQEFNYDDGTPSVNVGDRVMVIDWLPNNGTKDVTKCWNGIGKLINLTQGGIVTGMYGPNREYVAMTRFRSES